MPAKRKAARAVTSLNSLLQADVWCRQLIRWFLDNSIACRHPCVSMKWPAIGNRDWWQVLQHSYIFSFLFLFLSFFFFFPSSFSVLEDIKMVALVGAILILSAVYFSDVNCFQWYKHWSKMSNMSTWGYVEAAYGRERERERGGGMFGFYLSARKGWSCYIFKPSRRGIS